MLNEYITAVNISIFVLYDTIGKLSNQIADENSEWYMHMYGPNVDEVQFLETRFDEVRSCTLF